ncbi:hypothetical protein QR77_29120 [Streptomyces sp. 150FB]|nr:hypothetical protein QR77_29120 [Streptomyces sp. 150FB]
MPTTGQEQPRDSEREPAAARPVDLPLTHSQREIWFASQLGPEFSRTWNEHVLLTLRGDLDRPALEAALRGVVARHESLRAVIAGDGSRAIVLPGADIELPLVDLTEAVGPPAPDARADDRLDDRSDARLDPWLDAWAAQPYDLTRPPLSAALLRTGPAEHHLFLGTHHAAIDGSSLGTVLAEIALLYTAAHDGAGDGAALPPAPQYRAYARWYEEQTRDAAWAEAEAYWTERYRDMPPGMALPADRARGAEPGRRAGHVTAVLDDACRALLAAEAAKPGHTPFLLLLSAYAAALHRITDQSDLMIGAPIAVRWEDGTEDIVGNCTNVLPIRSQAAGGETFGDLLARIQEELFTSYEHSLYPFSAVCRSLGVPMDGQRNSLFATMFNLTGAAPELELPGLDVRVRPGRSRYAKSDLTVDVSLRPDEVRFDFEYDSGLFEERTVRALVSVYLRCLRALLERPGEQVDRLALLSDAEGAELFAAVSTPVSPVSPVSPVPPVRDRRSVVELFEEQAAVRPKSPAVRMGPAGLSYAELDSRANQLAHRLTGLGVGPEVRVAVLLDRSPDMPAAMLGVWKAGGAFVPLDVENPPARWASITADAAVSLLVVHERLREAATVLGLPMVVLDDPVEAGRLAALPAVAPERATREDDLAYVIFTSGSTGRPKGVEIAHRGLSTMYWGWERAFGLRDGHIATHLAMANFCFDVFTADVVRSLCSGARLLLCPKETLVNPGALLSLVTAEEVGFAEFVPVVLRALSRHAEASGRSLAPFKVIAVSSDAIYSSELAGVQAVAGPDIALFNTYGLTEATVDSTYFRYHPGRSLPGENAPIGAPFANTRAYVLDQALRAVPPGVLGRLYVAGPGVGRGYARRPALTAERFLPDPWGGPGERMYDTGDLARQRWEGDQAVIDFFGRDDNQVKVRGFRVELGEIESALRTADGVSDAAVVADPGPSGTTLTAYLVPEGGTGAAGARAPEWIAKLRDSVPAYMVPSRFFAVESLPVSANGKLVRGALKALPARELSHGREVVAARSGTEKRLVAIWEELLGRDEIGVTDEFFQLGGHSLLAMRAIAGIHDAFGVEIPVREFLSNTTIERLAAEIGRLDAADGLAGDGGRGEGPAAGGPVVALARDGGAELPVSFMQRRFWFLERLWPGQAMYNLPCAIRLTGRLDPEDVRLAWQAVVDRHEVLRCSFAEVRGVPVLRIASEQRVDLPVVDLRELPAEGREARLRELTDRHARHNFDLGNGPLAVMTLVRLSEREYRLLFVVHHVAADFWSVNLLMDDFQEAYAALAEQREARLPPLDVQFADVAAWQERWLSSAGAEAQLAFWRRTLKPLPKTLELPVDRPRTRGRASVTSAVLRQRLDDGLSASLTELARREGVTLFMVLLTALQTVLAELSGQRDFAIGTPVASRTRTQLRRVVGPLINTVALRADLTGAPSLRTLLARVRDTSLDAFAHQEMPFDRIVEEVRPRRAPGHHPIFQVLYQYLPEQPLDVSLPGVELSVEELRSTTTVFDLMLDVVQVGQGLEAVLQYDAEHFEASTVGRLLDLWRAVLRQMVLDLDSPAAAAPGTVREATHDTAHGTAHDTADGSDRQSDLNSAQAQPNPEEREQ